MTTVRCVLSLSRVRLRAPRWRLASTCAALLAATVLAAFGAEAEAATAYAIRASDGYLIQFDADELLGSASERGAVTGLAQGEQVFDLDIRPRNSLLYALAVNPVTGIGRVYRVTFSNGQQPAATQVSTTDMMVGPSGVMDFDPVNDRLRVIGATGQSYRLNPDSGALESHPLPNVAGAALGGLAFSNNFDAPDQATLYGIDLSGAPRLVTIGTPNGTDGGATGTIAPLSALAPAPDAMVGFDITANTGEAYALLPGSGPTRSALYRFDLATGVGTLIGDVGGPSTGRLRALAIHTRASLIYGIDSSNRFVTFLSARPNEYRAWNGAPGGTAQPITPALSGAVLGMDVRPSTGEVYVVAAGTPANLYKVHPATAVSTFVATLQAPLSNTAYGMYFEMQGVEEQLHLLGNQGQNVLINPDTGQTIFALGSIPPTARIVAATRPGYGDVLAIDSASDRLVVILPIHGDPTPIIDVPPALGFDTDDRATLDHAPGDDAYFASLTAPAASASDFFLIRRGQPARRIGSLAIGADSAGLPLIAMAVAPQGRIQFIAPKSYFVTEGPGGVLGQPVPITIERIAGHDGPITVEVGVMTSGTAIEG